MKKRTLLLIFIALSTITAFAQNVPSYVPSNGLLGWWPFNGNANDESGNGNHGTVNLVAWGMDRFGNNNASAEFNSMYQRGIRVVNPNGTFTNEFTYSFWLKTNGTLSYYNNIIAAVGQCMLYGPYPSYQQAGVVGKLGFSGWLGLNNSIIDLNDGIWHHGLTVIDWTGGSIDLYIDGVLNASHTFASQAITQPIHFDFGQLYNTINDPVQGPQNIFAGTLDDIGIWNRALTACEIQDLYHAQLYSASMNISAGANQSICAGENITLSGTGGTNYQWNNNVVDGQAFTPNQSANYVLNGTDSLGCQGTDTVVVTVLENAVSTLTQTALDSYTLNGQTYTQSGTYTQTVPAANGCDSTITLNLTLDFTGIDELGMGAKKLVKITDLNGKNIPRRKNTLMLFIYEDGTVERVVEMEE